MTIPVFGNVTVTTAARGLGVKLQKVTVSEKMSFWQGNNTGNVSYGMELVSS
jgi:hypothetical protein